MPVISKEAGLIIFTIGESFATFKEISDRSSLSIAEIHQIVVVDKQTKSLFKRGGVNREGIRLYQCSKTGLFFLNGRKFNLSKSFTPKRDRIIQKIMAVFVKNKNTPQTASYISKTIKEDYILVKSILDDVLIFSKKGNRYQINSFYR